MKILKNVTIERLNLDHKGENIIEFRLNYKERALLTKGNK